MFIGADELLVETDDDSVEILLLRVVILLLMVGLDDVVEVLDVVL